MFKEQMSMISEISEGPLSCNQNSREQDFISDNLIPEQELVMIEENSNENLINSIQSRDVSNSNYQIQEYLAKNNNSNI
jgi:hypothetical protein